MNLSKTTLFLAIFLVAAVELLLDLVTPLGVSDWVLYFIPLLLSAYVGGRNFPYLLAAVFSGLSLVGFYLSAPGVDPQIALTSRLIGIGVFWVVALFISRRKETEELLRRTERALRTITDCNQMLVRATNETLLLQDVCYVIVEQGGYRMAWVGFPENDANKSVRPVAWAGCNAGYLEKANVSWADTERGRGPTGTAARTGKLTICHDFRTDPAFAPWREEAIKRGYVSSIVLPLQSAGKTFGVLSIYAAETTAFNPTEIELLKELADDLAYGIHALRTRSEHRQAEAALRASEAELMAAQRVARIGSWRLDLATGQVAWTAELYRMMGLDPGQPPPLYAAFEKLFTSESWHRLNTAIAQTRETGSAYEVELEMIRPDGSRGWMLANGEPLRDEPGKVIGLRGTAQDITERKRGEESHARLMTAVEQSAETIVITDPEGAIVYANPAFERTSGYTRAEALGQNPRILKSGKHDAEFYRRMWERLKRGESWRGRIINRRKDGALYEEDVAISPVRDAAGTIINYVAVKRDVTREVQLEAQFRQSQKMEAVGQLASGVAHDFNNILAIIQLQAGLLKAESNLSDHQRESAHEIELASQRAANLIRQLLLFSRKQTLQPRDLDLRDVVTSITKMLHRILGETIQMQLKFAAQPLLIHADAGMIDQILMNLTVNARDAMPTGGQLIIETSAVEFDEDSATQHSKPRSGAFACISVSDTGCGIRPEILSRIFEPFFTTKDVGKGSGLGLATVFGIVQQHQGWINVYSEPSRGTSFRIYFPRLTGPSHPQTAPAAPVATRGGRETILLVEDDEAVRTSVHSVLSRLGYHVLKAATGAEALTVWKQHRQQIRLLITDLVMPGGMNGKELARQLLRQAPKLQVIYASGYSADIVTKDFPLEENVNFLAKPFEAHALAQTVRNRLDKV